MFNKVECICLNESAPPIISLILTSDPGQVFKMVNCEVIVCICGNENIKFMPSRMLKFIAYTGMQCQGSTTYLLTLDISQ